MKSVKVKTGVLAQQGGWGVWGGNGVYDDKNNNDDVVAILQRIEILIIMIMMMT